MGKCTEKRCSYLRHLCYSCDMLDMAKGDAAWRKEMTEGEARELALAERAREAANDQYKAVFSRLKNRCIQRLRKKGARDE